MNNKSNGKSRFRPLFTLMCVVALCSCADQKQNGNDFATREQVANLVRHINEKPYFHFDFTPGVEKLIQIGRPALKYGALDLLLSDDRETRIRAWRVVEGVTMAEMGFVRGEGWPKGEDSRIQDEKWRQLWRENGTYDWDAPKKSREAAYQKWVQWACKTE